MADATYLTPLTTFRYKVTIGDSEMGCSEISSMDATIDVIEYREGWMFPTPKKYPGMVKYGNLTLKRALTEDTRLIGWIMNEIQGSAGAIKKDVKIELLEGSTTKYSWVVKKAWVTKYTTPDFKASSGELAFESIELAHEGWLQQTPPAKEEPSTATIENSGFEFPDLG